MSDKPLGRKVVQHGRQYFTDAGAIGGVDSEFDDDGRPIVILAVMPDGGDDSVDLDLHEGDTFELGPELWQVTEISDPNTDGWAADVTRLR